MTPTTERQTERLREIDRQTTKKQIELNLHVQLYERFEFIRDSSAIKVLFVTRGADQMTTFLVISFFLSVHVGFVLCRNHKTRKDKNKRLSTKTYCTIDLSDNSQQNVHFIEKKIQYGLPSY